MNNGWHVRHTEQQEQLFTDRFVDCNKDRGLFRHLLTVLKQHYSLN